MDVDIRWVCVGVWLAGYRQFEWWCNGGDVWGEVELEAVMRSR